MMSPKISHPLTVELGLLGYLHQAPCTVTKSTTLKRGPGLVWRLKQAQLYALLARFEEAATPEHIQHGGSTGKTTSPHVYQ